jgi:hypothetical protein
MRGITVTLGVVVVVVVAAVAVAVVEEVLVGWEEGCVWLEKPLEVGFGFTIVLVKSKNPTNR